MPRLDGGGAVERRLQRRAALPVHGRRADGLRPVGDEHRLPTDVERLLSDLRHASHLHVLDLGGIEIETVEEAVQDLGCELVRTHARKRPTTPPDRRPNGIDEKGVRHLRQHRFARVPERL